MANENKTYFAKAVSPTQKFSYADIFSGVFAKHTRKDLDNTFSAGMHGRTPEGGDLLTGWQKPWVFSRVLLYGLIAWALIILSVNIFGDDMITGGALFIVPAAVVPLSGLFFFWEMNIPRNIPFYDIVKWTVLGGIACSSIATVITILTQSYEIENGIVKYFSVGVVEETTKLILVALILRKRERCWGLNGLLVGAAVGCGFAVFETNGYGIEMYMNYSLTDAITNQAGRGALGLCGHVAWAAMYGCALALVKGKQKLEFKHFVHPTFLIAFFSAILLHGIFDIYVDSSVSPLVTFFAEHDLTGLYYLMYGNTVTFILCAMVIFITLDYAIILWLMRKSVRQVVLCADDAHPVHRDQAIAAAQPQFAAAAAHDDERVLLLECLSGELSGQTYKIKNGRTFTIGRGAQNNVQYAESAKGISRKHCSVYFDGSQAIVTDLGSTHGTYFDSGLRFQENMRNLFNSGDTFCLASPKNKFRVTVC